MRRNISAEKKYMTTLSYKKFPFKEVVIMSPVKKTPAWGAGSLFQACVPPIGEKCSVLVSLHSRGVLVTLITAVAKILDRTTSQMERSILPWSQSHERTR
jgi:hypothetical protein